MFGESDYGDVFEYDNTAEYTNPFTGEPMGEVIEDPSIWERISRGAVSGALSFVNPFAAAGGIARASGRVTGRASEGGTRLAGKAIERLGRRTGSRGLQSQGAETVARAGRNRTSRLEEMGRFHDRTGGTGAYGRANRLAGGGSPVSTTALRGAQSALRSPGIRDAAESIIASTLMPTGGSPNIHGTASANPSAGGGGSGVGGVGNRASMGQGDKQIWSGALEQQRGSGYGTKKGDNMKIGEQILKEVDMRIHKAHCGTTHKADCPTCGKGDCKCKDNTKKGSKKPAHGMVIIIGSKDAGPGPSKDGKRVKKD